LDNLHRLRAEIAQENHQHSTIGCRCSEELLSRCLSQAVHGYTEQQREHDQGPDGREWRRLIASAGQFVHHYNRQHQQGKNHGGDDDVGQSTRSSAW
jgi:hypothetical protein